MNRNEFFKGIGTETLTPERLSELMTSAVAEMAYHCNFLSAPFWAVTDILYGRKNLLVAVWPLTLKEDASVTGCLFLCLSLMQFASGTVLLPARKYGVPATYLR